MSWLALALALSNTAQASAYYFLDAGTRGMARGGAFVASADDLSAQYYNPAALIHLDGPQAMINLSFVDQNVDFARQDIDEETGDALDPWPNSPNLGPPMMVPSFAVAHDFGLDDWMFSLGMFPPHAPDMEYDADGAQRYSLVDSLVWQINAGPNFAWRPLPWLTVGGGVMWTLVRAEQELSINLCTDDLTDEYEGRCPPEYYTQEWRDEQDDPDSYTKNDVNIGMKMLDPMNISWQVGLLIDPVDWLTIGASFKPPIKVAGEGTLTADFDENHWLLNTPEVLDETHYEDSDIVVHLTMPMIARLGVAVRPIEPLELEVAGVYEGWHTLTEVLITDVDLTLVPIEDGFVTEDIVITDDVHLAADYVDSYSLRLGGQYDFRPPFTLRAGIFYESSAVPPATQGVAVVDGPKYGYGIGGSWLAGNRVSLDIALLQSWIKERKIIDSQMGALEVPVNLSDFAFLDEGEEPPSLPIENGYIVGNGTFSSNMLQMSIGTTVYFGKRG